MKTNKIISWTLNVRWSENPSESEDISHNIPDHIVRDIEYYFDLLEDEENKYYNEEAVAWD